MENRRCCSKTEILASLKFSRGCLLNCQSLATCYINVNVKTYSPILDMSLTICDTRKYPRYSYMNSHVKDSNRRYYFAWV